MARRIARSLFLVGLLAPLMLASGCFRIGASPIALFIVSSAEGESPLTVIFDASESDDPNGAVIRYEWDFGDGSTATGRIAIHVYIVESETTFTVRLTVTDDDGNPSSTSRTVTVRPALPPPETFRIEFVWPFHYDADGDDAVNLNDEYFALRNTGSQPLDLTGWTVSNERGAEYRFPDGFVLSLGATVYIHSGVGANSDAILHWNAEAPVWNDQSDIAVLRDAGRVIVTYYAYSAR